MQETKPLVTIVTITFNLIKSGRENTFRQCLESVHNQTYENIEHIVVDGASNDGTIDLIKKYADKGWIRYISEPDNGIYDAMNKGIKLANGKYIAFLNSDDFYHNREAVEFSVKELEKTGADYSFADTIGVDNKTDKSINVWSGNINLLPFGTHYCHQSMFVKKTVLLELGGFDLEFKVSADSDLMIKLVALGKKHIYISRKIVSYRSGGLSNKHQLQCREDHSRAFYKHIGKDIGMTLDDCFSIWNFSLFKEKDIRYCLNTAYKLSKSDWTRELVCRLNDYYKEIGYRNVYLFNLLPIFSIKNKKRKQVAYFMGIIPVGVVKSTLNENKLYALGFLPFVSIKNISKSSFTFDKFIIKYYNRLLNSGLRKPVRGIYYAIRMKKMK